MKRGIISWPRCEAPLARGTTALFLGLALAPHLGCESSEPPTSSFERPESVPVSKRAGTVVVEGCRLTSGQSATLESASARSTVQTVILLCLSAQSSGQISPIAPEGRASVETTVSALHGLGYRVHLGLGMTDETGAAYPITTALTLLSSSAWQSTVAEGLPAALGSTDGLEIALPQLHNNARNGVTAFVAAVASVIRPQRQVGIFLPPSVTQPSDLPEGEAFDVAALASSVDRGRLMTLDFSCCGSPPGPTTESGWAVDAWRLARQLAPALPLDVSFPLYGIDFSNGQELPVSFLEARALEDYYHARAERGPTYAPHFAYVDMAGRSHELWYDDTPSTLLSLRAWEPPTLPIEAGVLFYGLGAEDPALWETLARSAQ